MAAFTAEDFRRWNQTVSALRLPKKIVGTDSFPQLRSALVKAIGAEKLKAVQALPNFIVHIEWVSRAVKIKFDVNGLDFRGVHLTPMPAYEHLTNVFVDRAPLPMQAGMISDALAPYGRVVVVKDLYVKGARSVRTGTRMVTMRIDSPIPSKLAIAGFPCSIRYRGQPPYCPVCSTVGHAPSACPSRRKPSDKRARPIAAAAVSSPSQPPNLHVAPSSSPQSRPLHAPQSPNEHAAMEVSVPGPCASSQSSPGAAAPFKADFNATAGSRSPRFTAPLKVARSATTATAAAVSLTVELTNFRTRSSCSEEIEWTRRVSQRRVVSKLSARSLSKKTIVIKRKAARRAAHSLQRPILEVGNASSPEQQQTFAVATENRFEALVVEETVESDDMVAMEQSVIDPLPSPTSERSSPRQVTRCSPPLQDLQITSQEELFASPPAPTREGIRKQTLSESAEPATAHFSPLGREMRQLLLPRAESSDSSATGKGLVADSTSDRSASASPADSLESVWFRSLDPSFQQGASDHCILTDESDQSPAGTGGLAGQLCLPSTETTMPHHDRSPLS